MEFVRGKGNRADVAVFEADLFGGVAFAERHAGGNASEELVIHGSVIRRSEAPMTDPLNQNDPLTGLASRGAIIGILKEELRRRKTSSSPLTVIRFDVNGLKSINNEIGFLGGDAVLAQLGRLLSVVFRSVEYVGRFGGDLFLVVGPGTDSKQAVLLGERICDAVAEAEFLHDRREIGITVRHGIAVAEADANPTFEEITQAASMAMDKSYALKNMPDGSALLGKKSLVAVVNDDPDARLLFSHCIERYGCAAEGFQSGEEFLANANRDTACVLMNQVMVGLQGHQTFHQMRRSGWGIPVISECGGNTYKKMMELYGCGQVAHIRPGVSDMGLGSQLEDAIRRGLLAAGYCFPPRMSLLFNPAILTWNDGTILRLARSISEGGTYQDLPILADALEDGGCSSAAVLAHCRSPDQHFRGCWVIDSLLGQQ